VQASSEVAVALPDAIALHARPAGAFVKTALRFQSRLTVASNGKTADAKSILAVVARGASGGPLMEFWAEGDETTA
jgi:phosphocarrier protein HPr